MDWKNSIAPGYLILMKDYEIPVNEYNFNEIWKFVSDRFTSFEDGCWYFSDLIQMGKMKELAIDEANESIWLPPGKFDIHGIGIPSEIDDTPLRRCSYGGNWKLYQGFTDSFEYCDKCGKKKNG